MNPRVSRSSALASKATGFPIAKIAAKLAVGYALEEIPNDITQATPASFEPTIDYVVTKVPRFAFEKFPGAEGSLSTHMKSVGEAMAIGRTFRESFAKAMRSRELDAEPEIPASTGELLDRLATPAPDRFDLILEAFRRGVSPRADPGARPDRPMVPARAQGAGDRGDGTEGLDRTFKSVDTCAAEFEARTPYYYSAHERRRSGGHGRVRRGPARRSRLGRDPRLGPEPDRAGDRVRLLLRARGDDRARLRPRRGDDQLQSGDRLHRLRHLRPPVLRAADRRRRAGGDRARAPRGRDRPVRGPDAAEARQGAGGGRGASLGHARGRDRPGRGSWPLRGAPAPARHRSPAVRHGAVGRRGGRDRRGGRLPPAGASLLRARRPCDGDLLHGRGTGRATWSST